MGASPSAAERLPFGSEFMIGREIAGARLQINYWGNDFCARSCDNFADSRLGDFRVRAEERLAPMLQPPGPASLSSLLIHCSISEECIFPIERTMIRDLISGQMEGELDEPSR
jgi:hypothetical protein